MKLPLCAAALGLILLPAQVPANESSNAAADVVSVARRVAAQRFSGFTYGPDQSKKQIDCVQFTGAVVEALLKRPLTKAETDALYIRGRFEDLNAAVESGDARTRGIQTALADLIKRGTAVAAADVREGDFVQYWIRRKDGKWAGHSAVVSRVFKDAEGAAAIAIFSSNQSTNGIAEMDFGAKGLSLRGTDRRFYFVRFLAAVPPPAAP